MAFTLDGKPLAVDVPFTVGETNYPANWLRLTTKAEKEAIGIKEVDDPKTYDSRFYWENGTAKALDDKKETDEDGVEITTLGVKSLLKAEEKATAGSLLAPYDWYVVRKAEKGTAIPTKVQTFRDQVRTACDTREKEIDACKDTAALVTLFSATYDKDGNFEKYNMTQYPEEDLS